ncbi:MAG: NfeD family protein [Spongiibacter sp.]|nr:NfeD family protein [Spongiibacter sp.]
MEWLDANIQYWHWMVFGLLLVASEVFVPSFVMLWFGASAIAVGLITAVVPLSITVQLLIWGALSAIDLFIWFRFVHPKMKNRSYSGMGREQIVGKEAMVIDVSERGQGHLRFSVPILGSEEWSFRCESAVAIGDKVVVLDVTGNSLLVRPG